MSDVFGDDAAGWLASFSDDEVELLAFGQPEGDEFVGEARRRGLRVGVFVERPVDTGAPVGDGGCEAAALAGWDERPFRDVLAEARAGDQGAADELMLRAGFSYRRDGSLREVGKDTLQEAGLL